MSMSDRIVVMNGGIAEQVGAPFDIYNRPKTKFVANFVGTLNTLEARIENAEQGIVSLAGVRFTLPEGGLAAQNGTTLAIALRPEALQLGCRDGREVVLPATIEEVHFLGSVIRLRANIAGTRVSLDTFNRADTPPPAIGASVEISLSARDVIVLQG